MYYAINMDKHWAERAALGVAWLTSALSLFGYGVFTTYPRLLNSVPGAAEVYGRMFALAPRVQIIVAFVALAFVLWRSAGLRWLGAFAAVYAVSLASELLGTTVGLPFGPYSYTDGLGVKLFDHVPVLIPISWFFMALPAFALARGRIVLGALLLASWDLALDPAMSFVTKYWVWATDGAYYGMPLLNLFGWFVTGLALMAVLSLTRADRWAKTLDRRWLWSYYGANLVLPVGMCVVAGHWGAVAASALAIAACAAMMRAPVPALRQSVA